MESELNVIFNKGLPSKDQLKSFIENPGHNLICLDDLQQEVVNDKQIEKLFTQNCHHKCVSVIFISQNLFYQGKCARTLHLNTYYTVLLRNQRNIQQIGILGKQIGKNKLLVEAFKDAVSRPYGYLILDLAPNTSEDLQMKTNIFPHEAPMVVYKQ